MSFDGSYPSYGSTSHDNVRQPVPTRESSLYHQLCDSISANIFTIDNFVTMLETSCIDIGSENDTHELREKIHKNLDNTNDLVHSTVRFVQELKHVIRDGPTREQKLQCDRLEKDFKITVQRYDVVQKVLVPKMKVSIRSPQGKKASNSLWGVGEDDEEEQQSLLDADGQQQQQRLLQENLEFEQGMLMEREERVKEIEIKILDVHEIFRDLATIVHEQGETLGTIEDNITRAATEVETGTSQLSKASNYQTKYRKKTCCLMIILLAIAVIITVIVIVEVKT